MPDSTHVSIMPLWRGTTRQKEFWCELGEWLERVDAARLEDEGSRRERSSRSREKGKEKEKVDRGFGGGVVSATAAGRR